MDAVISWGGERHVTHNAAELDVALARLARSCTADAPVLVRIECGEHEVTLGRGVDAAFVQVAGAGGEPPYMVAVGDPAAEGSTTFMLDGMHDTEVDARTVVSVEVAEEIVRALVLSGERPARVAWLEV